MPAVVLFPPRRLAPFRPPPDAPSSQGEPLPMDRWPKWARDIAARRQDGDRSLLDIIEREHGPAGSDPFKLWHAQTFGIWTAHCNCHAVARRLASQFLLPPPPPTRFDSSNLLNEHFAPGC